MVSVTYTPIFGDLEEDEISTSLVERGNLTIRMTNGRMVRKTLGFSKTFQDHRWAQMFNDAVYNFVKPHKGLRQEKPDGIRKWLKRTPAMAVGITDHLWSLEKLVTYRVPPLRGQPNERGGLPNLRRVYVLADYLLCYFLISNLHIFKDGQYQTIPMDVKIKGK